MFKRVFLFYVSYLAAMTYSQTLLMLWFFRNGVSYVEMLTYFMVQFGLVVVLLFALEGRTFSSRFALWFGVATSGIGVWIASMMTHTYQIYITAFFFALNIVFFWIIYNTLHFTYSSKEETGFKSGIYFLLSPILSAVLAPAAGLVVEKIGFHFLFASAVAIYLIPIAITFLIPCFEFTFHTIRAVRNLEHPILVFFQGYFGMITSNVIPIFTLFFIKSPVRLGGFFGYLAIFTAIAALTNSKISDRIKKRAAFFYVFVTLNVLSYIPLVFSRSFAHWQLFAGISSLMYGLANPFNLTLTLDYAKQNTVDTMVSREVFLNLGRAMMVVVALCIFYFTQSLFSALIYSSLIVLLYPLIAYSQKVYRT